ncbi:MAG TPA: aldo/keto reductase [Rhodanobacteraceae bacterium]|jgi:L-glyceraldehyde 3-phosphate reductase|nr:aldo/keto reductase [Rhodanobacteraceae bacterium]
MSPDRYGSMTYRRCGRSGLRLPAISFGLWQGTGSYVDEAASRAIVHTAFDHGITHFDLANNYGSPPGASEELFGRVARGLPRHELVVSSKAGYYMWPGPYGEWGSRKHLVESCEQSLKRLGLDHVDIFYSHRFDPDTPLEETLGALDTLVRQGKAIYAGISSYADPHFSDALRIVRARNWAPITIHQPRYSMLDRNAERNVLPTAGKEGVGVIGFSALAQGLLTGKYLDGIPDDSRVVLNKGNGALTSDQVTPRLIVKLNALDAIARQRGQTLAQMALAWLLKDERVTSVLIGASKPGQITESVGCLAHLSFDAAELALIERILAE